MKSKFLFLFSLLFLSFLVFIFSCGKKERKVEPLNIAAPYVFAHYMTWFGNPAVNKKGEWYNWQWKGKKPHDHIPDRILPDGRRDIAATYYPVIGPYESSDPDLLEYHILLAKLSGIDGFVINWYGFEDEKGKPRHENESFKALLKKAEELDFLACIDIDDKCMFPPYKKVKTRKESVLMAKKDVERICAEYGASKAYFKINGRPVITNFGWDTPSISGEKAIAFGPEEWRKIIRTQKKSNPVFIHDYQWHWNKPIEETGFTSSADSFYSWVGAQKERRTKFYDESIKLLTEKKISFVSGQMNPGFDNLGTWGWGGGRNIIPRDGGKLYEETFAESVAAGSKWIQIVTWNDFAEGSTIEPSKEYGYEYLEKTKALLSSVKKIGYESSLLAYPEKIYNLRKRINSLNERPGRDVKLINEIKTSIDSMVKDINTPNPETNPFIKKKLSELEKRILAEEKRLPLADKAVVTLKPGKTEVFSGDKIFLTASVKNVSKEKLDGMFFLNYEDMPATWIDFKKEALTLKSGETREIKIQINIPPEANDDRFFVSGILNAFTLYSSPVAEISIKKKVFGLDIINQNILTKSVKSNLAVRLRAKLTGPVKGALTLSLPAGIKADRTSFAVNLPAVSDKEFSFSVTPDKPGVYEIKCDFNGNFKNSVTEKFLVIEPGAAGLLETDCNHDGIGDIVVANDKIESLLTQAMGARMLTLFSKQSGKNILYLNYPSAGLNPLGASSDWQEYGGVNDIFPTGWPGEVWNNNWTVKVLKDKGNDVSAVFSARLSNGLDISREISLTGNSNSILVKYKIKNLSGAEREFQWGSHPDLAPGGKADKNDITEINTKEGAKSRSYAAALSKFTFSPSDGRALTRDSATGDYLRQSTDLKNAELGIWEAADFYTVELFTKPEKLKPNQEKIFTVEYTIGKK